MSAYGEDRTGFQMKYMRYGGGYYFKVGCSDLIVEGKVGLTRGARRDQAGASKKLGTGSL